MPSVLTLITFIAASGVIGSLGGILDILIAIFHLGFNMFAIATTAPLLVNLVGQRDFTIVIITIVIAIAFSSSFPLCCAIIE
jgi:hypothetical protein